MNRTQKTEEIAAIRSRFDRMAAAVLVDFTGITVEAVTKLRTSFRNAGVEYKVVKNTLVEQALKGTPYENKIASCLVGMTAIAWSYEDPSAAAKVVRAFRQEQDKEKDVLKVKGAILDGTLLDAKTVEEQLANMPGKDELRARLLATLQAPMQQFALLQAPSQNFVYLLAAKKDASTEA